MHKADHANFVRSTCWLYRLPTDAPLINCIDGWVMIVSISKPQKVYTLRNYSLFLSITLKYQSASLYENTIGQKHVSALGNERSCHVAD